MEITQYFNKFAYASEIWVLLINLYYVVSIAVVVLVIGLYQSIKANQEENLRNKLLATQIDSIRHHIEQVECLYQNIRGIRHDMANHIMTLERLYASNQTEEARKYTTELKAALAQVVGDIIITRPIPISTCLISV